MALLTTLSMVRQWPAILLALWPALAIAGDSAADYYVHDLPGLPTDVPPIKMHAGHIQIEPEHNSNLFFWHFENQHIADRQRTVIWLNGGPGCSSEDGALMEIGPYRVQKDNKLTLNNGSWNEFANLLFVDNPVGTGFSFVDTDSYLHELDQMADQFMIFLEKFFALFPQYEQDDIYIAGESYAGQHIPYVAKSILKRNKDGKGQHPWNLKGLLIGNGWISPYDQYEGYITFSVDKGIIKKDSDDHKKLKEQFKKCQDSVAQDPGHVDYSHCEEILTTILRMTRAGDGDNACFNMYDVRLKDSYPSCGMNWPSDLRTVTPYLRNLAVTKALHVSEHKSSGWQECNGAVGSAFRTPKSKPAIDLLPDLIKEVPLLLFSGAEDLICNHYGTEDLISNLEWNGGKGFEVTPGNWAPRRDWTFEGESAGFWQEARNLTYVLFKDASHMVPFDWPRRSRDMLDRFMGVDVSDIGGLPADSRIDGEKGPETSVTVGNSNNSTGVEEEAQGKIDEAKWQAYRKSGEIVLVIVTIAAVAWGWFIWRERRKRAAYRTVSGVEPPRANGLRRKVPRDGDLEASAFDESELDDLHVGTPTTPVGNKYSVGDDSDEGENVPEKNGNGSYPRAD